MARREPEPESEEPQMVLFDTLEDVDEAARLVLAKEAEVASAQEARIGREGELQRTPAWEAFKAAEAREDSLRSELRDLKKDLQEGVLNRLREGVGSQA